MKTVEVWRIPLWPAPPDLEERYQSLTPEERERADRYHFEHSRQQLVISHFARDRILDRHLGPEPRTFVKAKHGKPFIEGSELRFNLSHSHQMALLAVGPLELGVDVEYVERKTPYEDLAQRFFSAPEAAEFMALPQDRRKEVFFTIWTRKEAYIKAIGEGLSHPLDAFQVSLDRHNPYLVNCPGWHLYEVPVAADYLGALVTREAVEVKFFDFEKEDSSGA